MSNAVLPSFAGLAWSVSRKPMWSTVTKTSVSGREFRAAQFSYPTWQYRLTYELLREGQAFTEMQQLAAFFNARSGSFDSWLYTDPDDNAVVAQQFGVGDAATTAFQMVRSFGGYLEPVYDPAGIPLVEMIGGTGGIGSFEIDGPGGTAGIADGWTVFLSGGADASRTHTFALSATGVKHGSFAQQVQITLSTNTSASTRLLTNAFITATGGAQNTVSASIQTSVAGKVNLRVSYYNAALVQTGSDQTSSTVGTTGSLQTLSFTTTAPADATSMKISVGGITTTGESFFVDGLTKVEGATAYVPTSTRIALLPGADYTVTSGQLTMTRPPETGAQLVWTGSFYWRCRFLADALDFNQFMRQFWELRTLEFKTVKP